MTRQRRSHLLILALVPAVVFVAVRCADSSATAPADVAQKAPPTLPPNVAARLVKLHEERDWIGQFHNDALAYVFAKLHRIPAKGKNQRSVCEAARAAYAEFHKNRRGKDVPAAVDAEFESFCTGGSSSSSFARIVSAPTRPAADELSATAQAFIGQIYPAIDASTSFPDLASRINSIEADAVGSLSYDEAGAVVTAGEVALSSATYWAYNLPSWIPFTNSADYTVLLASRSIAISQDGISPLNNAGEFDWGGFAQRVWSDAKAAAKRAAGGDVRAAAKVLIGASLMQGPIIYDIVIGSAAAGSIMAVLQM